MKLFRIFGLGAVLLSQQLVAKENTGIKPDEPKPAHNNQWELMKMGAGCAAASAQRALDVNNVRTIILNGGDMWWNLSAARYEIPKLLTSNQVSKNSLFSGALWIGGVTNNNIRLAAQTYRQNGNDYYPGPLSIGTAAVSSTRCKDFDKIWSIKLTELDNFRKNPLNWSNPSDDIATWPANGNQDQGEAQFLAPFVDRDDDGKYEPFEGDYPSFDPGNEKKIPDQMMFILYNDKGNIHSETQGVPIGLELQTQAFAFSTTDEFNNMTFYRTKIVNRGTEKIDSCVFGQWVDPDLGNYADDYVECDVKRNLGICYNGDDNDEGVLGYGLNPPSVGVNFFEGPRRADGSEIGLTKFVYYNNDFSQQGNPTRPEHYWGYLNGRWKDGSPITYGGNGKGGSDSASFMFPGQTDPGGRAIWTERTAGNVPGDRRFLQTAGSFSLLPGAVNNVTIGVVWARASTGGATGSFNLLKQASDKALALFKNNFNLIVGPPAPKLEIVELNRKLVFKITNTDEIENFVDSFAGTCTNRTKYNFQGYQVFQLKVPTIPSDFYDLTQSQLVAQFDMVDSVSRIVNSNFDPELGEDVKQIMVSGENKGIQHSFMIEKDFFESGNDQTLVNFKNYHYFIVAYASASGCVTSPLQYLRSSKTIGEDALHIYTVTPHDPAPRGNGTKINSSFGDGIPVIRVEGTGNGGGAIQLSQESINEALSAANGYRSPLPKYIPGMSPVYIKVIDPLKVPAADFELWLTDTSTTGNKEDTLTPDRTYWTIRNVTTGEQIVSQRSIANPYEQLIPQWGLSVNIAQSIRPGDAESLVDQTNGFISATQEYANPNGLTWLTGIADEDPNYSQVPGLSNQINWIRAGTVGRDLTPPYSNFLTSDFAMNGSPLDPRKNFGKILNGTWSPYMLAARFRTQQIGQLGSFGPASDISAPAYQSNYDEALSLSGLQSVQVVFTADKTKWSRCLVLETGEDKNLNMGGADKLDVRTSQSVDKNGKPAPVGSGVSQNPDDANYLSETGMGWFPGYAINLETGERLNILFGEDSSMPTENGQDMVWNPTATPFEFKSNQFRPVFGGKHFVYVMGVRKLNTVVNVTYKPTRYDECRNYLCLLNPTCKDASVISSTFDVPYVTRKRIFFSQALYTTIPMPSAANIFKSVAEEGLIPNDVTIRINVKKPYAAYLLNGDTLINKGRPFYRFSTNGFAAQSDVQVGKKALDMVSVVPNPYYAFSQYEDAGNALDTRVKITNLPKRCQVNIYTMDGVLVRRISKDDDAQTYLEWDLKNDAKVPIVSGIYLIHVKATDLGEERIIKWFGVMRPADYDSF